MKKDNPEFDVPMGAYDSAEVCELVVLFVLHKLRHLPVSVALYRDDGCVLSRLSAQRTEDTKKEICRIIRELGLKAEFVAVNTQIIDYLDVTLDLSTGLYKEYRKPNSRPIYVSKLSNHPPMVIKNIPLNVNKRLNMLSCNEEVFEQSKPKYQEALRASGYTHELKYEKANIHDLNKKPGERKRRSRRRRVYWFNPPWDSRVRTDIGAKFLRILDETIPRGHVLYKLFNRHTVKVSYKCLGNLKKKISVHNHKVYSEYSQEQIRIREHNKKWREDYARQQARQQEQAAAKHARLVARHEAKQARQEARRDAQAARRGAHSQPAPQPPVL